ncbi:MAG: hypothetical protein J0L72_02010 [Armatimonadetes bacterium]|nr:hypothetical protein [Armatimonadota bacterium]
MPIPSDLNAAKAELMGGHLQSAVEICSAILVQQPANIEALELRAEAHVLMENFELARADYRRILAKSPGHASAVTGLENMNSILGEEIVPPPIEQPVQNFATPEVQAQPVPVTGFRLGSGFFGLGIGISIISFVTMLIAIGRIIQVAPEITAKQAKLQGDPEAMMQLLGPQFVSLFYLSMVVLFATGFWLLFDIIDRGGPYGWFVPLTIFGFVCLVGPYMGPGWFLIPIYMAVGRKKSPLGHGAK